MWTFVILIDPLFNKFYGYFHAPIIPVCHNEGFSMMNNYIVYIFSENVI